MKYNRLYESMMNAIARDIERLINESNEERFLLNKRKIRTVAVKDKKELQDIIAKSEPNKEENKGFWLFDEAIKKDSSYLALDKSPYYIHYLVYMYENTPVAMLSFSTKYYKEYDRSVDSFKFYNYIRLLDFQTISKYKGNGVQQYCMERFMRIARKYGYEGVTLMCYEDSLRDKYIKDGYEGNAELMWKTF